MNGNDFQICLCACFFRTEERLLSLLSMLELEVHQTRKLQLTDILEITKQSMNDQMPQTQGGLPWHLLRKVMGLHGMARSMSLRNGRSASIQTSVDGDDLVISDDLFSLVEMDRSDSSHPLFAFLRQLPLAEAHLQNGHVSVCSPTAAPSP